ncbi:imm11 family protein [Archangium sp.]|uniref:imm11 family protein n=1 Tax=Archangium sp. TaxID=1872627 RepID=UPI00389A6B62
MTAATHAYFILSADYSDQNCRIDELPRPLDKKGWRATEGERMGEHFPAGVRLEMSREHRGLVIPDYIPNTLLMPMVTGKLKTLLEQESGAEIEFLPFALYNHKGRVVAPECFIANVIGSRDWADMKKTRGEKSIISPGTFEALFQLQLDPEKVDPQAKLFRLNIIPRFLIVRDDLRAAFEQNGITGMKYTAMGERCRLV